MTHANDRPPAPPLDWQQLSMLREECVELTLRMGFVLEADHLQWQIDVRDPSSGTLLGMQSSPAVSAARWETQLTLIMERIRESLRSHVDPF